MKRMWILVANASRALCYERVAGAEELNRLADFHDPLGRSKGIELETDRAGYEGGGHGHSGAAYAPRMDSRTKEHEVFARGLAGYLNEAIAAHRCEEIAIVASNPFLGEVKSHLDPQSTKALTKIVARDLTSFAGEELQRRLREALLPS